MATNSSSLPTAVDDDVENEPKLSYEEGWDLIFSLFGSAKEMYASVGGSDAFLREERAAWEEDHVA